jgi:hypothetical protein
MPIERSSTGCGISDRTDLRRPIDAVQAVGKACAVLPADAGGRTPHAWAVRDDVAQDRAVAASGKLND